MTWKKYEVIYKDNKVIGSREVLPKPKKVSVPGQDRTAQVMAECQKLGIKDPVKILEMLVAKYAGTKSENYIKGRLKHAMTMLQ